MRGACGGSTWPREAPVAADVEVRRRRMVARGVGVSAAPVLALGRAGKDEQVAVVLRAEMGRKGPGQRWGISVAADFEKGGEGE